MTEAEQYMLEALDLAKSAMGHTAPYPMVGCVVVKNGKLVASGCHERYGEFHAERNALTRCKEDLTGADLYVTLEPCPMCAGAIINARIKRVFYGAKDEKAGSFGTKTDLLTVGYNHKPEVTGGIMEDECARHLSDFFIKLREMKKTHKK